MAQLSRRTFVAGAPIFAATLVRCGSAIFDRTRVAEAFVVDPDWTQYRPIVRALITAILPFENRDFPKITPEAIEERLIRLFPLEKEQLFLGLQRTLVLFDQIDLFPGVSGPLLQEEQKARDFAMRGGDWHALAAAIREADQRAFEGFSVGRASARPVGLKPDPHTFTSLPLEKRREYLALWRDSASIVKRQFHDAAKSLVMVTTYSLDDTWPVIGYAGPLVKR